MNLSVLESRLKERLPDEYDEIVEEEFDVFTMETAQMSDEGHKIGQAHLTTYEVNRLPTGNQHSDTPTVVQWQVVKGAAIHYGVRDWTSRVDSTLTYDENVALMERYGTKNNESTVRDMGHKIR